MGLFDDFMKRGRDGAARAKGQPQKPAAPITPQPQARGPQRPAGQNQRPAQPAPQPQAQPQQQQRTYTVTSGDTLSEIAQRFYGDPKAYMRIFEANRDILKDPNLIHPGQVLKIP